MRRALTLLALASAAGRAVRASGDAEAAAAASGCAYDEAAMLALDLEAVEVMVACTHARLGEDCREQQTR